MTEWNDGMTLDKTVRKVLPSYLVRCHAIISEDYPEIANMPAEETADYLLHLMDTGRIDIKLSNEDNNLIGCRITELGPIDEAATPDNK